jgi:hypothetical protein
MRCTDLPDDENNELPPLDGAMSAFPGGMPPGKGR